MNKKLLISFALLFLSLFSVNLFAEGTIGIIVNKDLWSSVQASVEGYAADIEKIEKKSVWLNATTFAENNTCQQMKDSIKAHYDSDGLEGVVLIGDLPVAEYSSSDFYGERDQYVCDLYYMDLNGSFSGSGSVFSGHSGDKEAEIWISRITASVLESNFDDEETMVNEYFARVKGRMYGQDEMERLYVIAGQKSEWGGLEAENQGDMGYEKDNIDCYTGSCGSQWGAALVEGREYGFVYSHSSPTMHAIGFDLSDQVSKDLDCRFYNSYACSNGDFDRSNMCGAYAYGDQGLICVGSAKTGSMKPGSFRAYNKPLGLGDCFGEAFRKWFNEEGIFDVYWHYGMNLQGAGSLNLFKYASGPYLTVASPNGGEEWEQGNTYEIKWSSNVSGNVKIELFKGGSLEKELVASVENNGLYSVEINKDFKVGEDYKIKITSLENDTILSESVENFTIMEEYIIATFPYKEDFNDLEKGSVILPRKWEQLIGDDLNWTVWEGKTPSKEDDQGAATGPDGDHPSGTGKYLYVESSGSNNPDKTASYKTPKINLNALKNPKLSFWYHMFSDNEGTDEMGDLYLDIDVDGTLKKDVIHLSGDKGDEWHEEKLDLSGYQGDRVILHFRAITGSGWASDICMDEFEISGDPTGIVNNGARIPLSFGLKCYNSRIYYQIPENAAKKHVSIKLFNTQGKLVRSLVNSIVGSGYHSVQLDKQSKLAAGLYLCRIKTEGFTKTIPIVLKK